MENVTIVVPAYNEQEAIENVISSLRDEGFNHLLVIDDGSNDDTSNILNQIGVNYISHKANKGYGASLKTGIKNSTTDFVAIYDGDGQHIPSELRKILREKDKYDMIVGARNSKSFQVANRKLGKQLIKLVVNKITSTKVPDFNSGLRVFKRDVIKRYLHLMPDGFSFSTTSTVTLLKLKYDVKYFPITVKERVGGKSNLKIKDGIKTLMLVFNLSVLFAPLRIFLPSAFFLMLISLVYFITYSIFYRVHVTGSMVMIFITGLIVFFMGILCEQISAARRELNNN